MFLSLNLLITIVYWNKVRKGGDGGGKGFDVSDHNNDPEGPAGQLVIS